MLRVGINGYGTIGKRVADAVRAQPDMTVVGVAKQCPDYVAVGATAEGYQLYATDDDRRDRFREIGIEPAGTVEDLVVASDVIVDATPAGVGATNRSVYERHDTSAVFQGGEDATVADMSFTARVNYDEAIDVEYVRVVSCNTTGLARVVAPLEERYGVEKVRATLVRRGGDPGQTGRGPINDAIPDPVSIPSHHGPDLQTVLPEVAVETIGLKVPTTMMHVHALNVSLTDPPEDVDPIRELFAAEDRLLTIPEFAGIDGAGTLKDFALDAGRPRGDIWENCLWEASCTLEGADFYCLQAIHQESDVVPENVDALRALTSDRRGTESRRLTNEVLGIGASQFADHTGLAHDRQPAD